MTIMVDHGPMVDDHASLDLGAGTDDRLGCNQRGGSQLGAPSHARTGMDYREPAFSGEPALFKQPAANRGRTNGYMYPAIQSLGEDSGSFHRAAEHGAAVEILSIVSDPNGVCGIAQQLQGVDDHPAVTTSPQYMNGFSRHWSSS